MEKEKANIPTLESLIKNQIEYYEEILKGEIRTVGSRPKIKRRLTTLRYTAMVLLNHSDLQPIMTVKQSETAVAIIDRARESDCSLLRTDAKNFIKSIATES